MISFSSRRRGAAGRAGLSAALLGLACACAMVPRPTTVSLPRSERPHEDFREADDAPHPSSEPAYFEWWYYDATFEDGTSATVALYSASMLQDHGPPGVLVNVVDPAGQTHTSYQAVGAGDLTFGGPGELTVGASKAVKEPGGRVRVTASGVSTEGQALFVELVFTPTMPGFKLGTGEVRFDGKVALGWVVPIPRADVEGNIRVGTAARAVKGYGYHDHNWGELNLQGTMAYWYWGRVATADLTAVYTSVNFRAETGLPPLRALIAGDAKRLTHVLPDARITPVGVRELEAAAREVPKGLFVEGPGAELRLTERKVVEAVDLSRRMGALRFLGRLLTRPAYVRTLCDYRWTSSLEGLPVESSGAALVEYMYVWRR